MKYLNFHLIIFFLIFFANQSCTKKDEKRVTHKRLGISIECSKEVWKCRENKLDSISLWWKKSQENDKVIPVIFNIIEKVSTIDQALVAHKNLQFKIWKRKVLTEKALANGRVLILQKQDTKFWSFIKKINNQFFACTGGSSISRFEEYIPHIKKLCLSMRKM